MHHPFTQLPRVDFAIAACQHLVLNAMNCTFDILGIYRPLLQRTLDTGTQFMLIKWFAFMIRLDNLRHTQKGTLQGRKTFPTIAAFAAPTNRVTIFGEP
jgi:hypothetical protein